MQIPTMREAYNFGTSLECIFYDLQKLNVPWKNENMAQSLDLAYLGLHSGCKLVMPYIAQLMSNNNGTLSTENRSTLAQMLVNLYGVQWQKQWDTLSFDYNPIENYDMTEEERVIENGNENRDNTYTRTNSGTDTLTQTGTITRDNPQTVKEEGETGTQDTATQTGTVKHDNPQTINVGAETGTKDTTTQGGNVTTQHPVTTTRNSTNTAENSGDTTNNVYGFNSENAVPSDTQNQSQNGTQTINETTTVEDSITETRDTTDTHNSTINENRTTTIENTNTETRDTTDTHNSTVNENRTTTVENTNTETRDTTDERNTSDTGNDTEKGTTERNNQLNRTLTRHGNIGVTTSQQMIESERQLWIWNYFQNIVFPDIDKMLTLAIY